MADSKPVRSSRTAFYRDVGRRLAELRMDNDLSQVDMAQMLQVSQQTVFAYENEGRRVPLDRALQYAKLLGVSIEQLLSGAPLPRLSPASIPLEMVRHVERLQKLAAADRRFIMRLTKYAVGRSRAGKR